MPEKIESEKLLERKLKKQVEALNGLCIKLLSTHISGLPDRLCLLPNQKIFFVELKTTAQKPNAIQLLVHNRLRKLGFKVYIIDSSVKITKVLTSEFYE